MGRSQGRRAEIFVYMHIPKSICALMPPYPQDQLIIAHQGRRSMRCVVVWEPTPRWSGSTTSRSPLTASLDGLDQELAADGRAGVCDEYVPPHTALHFCTTTVRPRTPFREETALCLDQIAPGQNPLYGSMNSNYDDSLNEETMHTYLSSS